MSSTNERKRRTKGYGHKGGSAAYAWGEFKDGNASSCMRTLLEAVQRGVIWQGFTQENLY